MTTEIDLKEVEVALSQNQSAEVFLTEMAKLVYAGEWNGLISFFVKRQQQHNDGLNLMVSLFSHKRLVADYRNLTKLALLENVHVTSPFHVYLWFFSGCYAMRHGEIALGKHIFTTLNKVIAQTGFNVERLPYLSSLKNTAHQFLTSDEIEVLLTQVPSTETEITYLGDFDTVANQDSPLFMAACNQVYFDKYADGFIHAFEQQGPILLHVVNADVSKLEAFLKKHVDKNVVVSYETYTGIENSPFYASLRFMRARQIMAKFDCDLVIADVDTYQHEGLAAMISSGKRGDAGIFRSLNIVPWYTAMATGIYFKNSAGGQCFTDKFGRLLASQMHDPTWYVDQSVLFSICAYFDQNPDQCQISYLKQQEGFYAQNIFKPRDGEDVKADLRVGVEAADY